MSDPATRAGAILEIDLGAIVANWRRLAEIAAPAACAAVVKANGYGLGATPVAQALLAAGHGQPAAAQTGPLDLVKQGVEAQGGVEPTRE